MPINKKLYPGMGLLNKLALIGARAERQVLSATAGVSPQHCPFAPAKQDQSHERRALSHLPDFGAKKSIPTTVHPPEPGTAFLFPHRHPRPPTMVPACSPSPAAALNLVQTPVPMQLIWRAPRSISGWKDHRPTFSTQWKWSISESSRRPGALRLGRKIWASSLIP